MTTPAKDRLDKLLQGKLKPESADISKPYFADSELHSIEQNAQQSIRPSTVETASSTMSGDPSRNSQGLDQMTSSDDDDYVSAFKKKPKMQPQRPFRRGKPQLGRVPVPDAFGYPKDAHIEPLAPLQFLPKGKVLENTMLDHPSDTESQSGTEDLPTKDVDGNNVTGHFCILQLVAKFPYKYMVDENDRVSRHFFAQNKFWNRVWDIYYVNPPGSLSSKPILLLPYGQVEALIEDIGRAFKIEMAVPSDPFTLSFFQDGTPQPTFLGTSKCREDVGDMQASIPMVADNYGEAPPNSSPALERSFAAYKAKIDRALETNNNKKKKNTTVRKKMANDRFLAVRNHVQQLKRTQRYLGLRPRTSKPANPDPNIPWAEQEMFRKEQLKKCNIILDPLDADEVSPYKFDKDPILISFDVEAYERGHHIITEIGVSTLDTRDVANLPPGDGGIIWRKQIRSRHFRIKGREMLRNTDFCIGDPDGFGFGTSEFVTIQEAADAVDACFEYPFSAGFQHDGQMKSSEITGSDENQYFRTESEILKPKVRTRSISSIDVIDVRGPTNKDHEAVNKAIAEKLLGPLDKIRSISESAITEQPLNNLKDRKIILVGHNIGSDLAFLETLGSKIFSAPRSTYPIAGMEIMGDGSGTFLPSDGIALNEAHTNKAAGKAHVLTSVIEALDTAALFRVMKKEVQTRSLANTLADLGICGRNLHNAGNDARYTLEALIALAIKARVSDDEVQANKEAELAKLAGNAEAKTDWETEKTKRFEEKIAVARREVLEDCEIWEEADATGTAKSSSFSPTAERISHGVNSRGVFATSLPIVSIIKETWDEDVTSAALKEQTNRKLKLNEGADHDPWLAVQLTEHKHKQYGTDTVVSTMTSLQDAELDDGGRPTLNFSQLLSETAQRKDLNKNSSSLKR